MSYSIKVRQSLLQYINKSKINSNIFYYSVGSGKFTLAKSVNSSIKLEKDNLPLVKLNQLLLGEHYIFPSINFTALQHCMV